jgi:poly-gamma-glutamate synthesis protein (capsule biosynthesis protein)
VLQPVEWFGETLVLYSLGNLIFDQPYPEDCRQGAILQVQVHRGRITDVEILPTVVEQHRVHLAGDEDAVDVFDRLGSAISRTGDNSTTRSR